MTIAVEAAIFSSLESFIMISPFKIQLLGCVADRNYVDYLASNKVCKRGRHVNIEAGERRQSLGQRSPSSFWDI